MQPNSIETHNFRCETELGKAILHTTEIANNQAISIDKYCEKAASLDNTSTIVVRERQKIAVRNGISPAERHLLDTAVHWIEKTTSQLVLITVEHHDADEWAVRKLIRTVKSRIWQIMNRAGLEPLYIEVLEGKYQVHSHIIACMPIKIAKKLNRHYFSHYIDVTPVKNIKNLRNYLLKEATPQAAYGTNIRRDKGSHGLGKGGGDRVRMSEALEVKLEQAGLMQPYRRTYASRDLAS